MTIAGLLASIAEATRRALIERFALRRMPLAADLAARDGDWNGRPLRLETELYEGGGRLARLHLARIVADDGTGSLTALGLPASDTGGPILGLDLVAFSGAFATAILELQPTVRELTSESVHVLLQVRRVLEATSEPRPPGPDPIFSRNAVQCVPFRQTRQELGVAAEIYVDAFADEIARADLVSQTLESQSRTAQVAMLGKLAGVKKQMRVLAKLFGEAWVASYFDEVFLARTAVR